MFGFIAGVPLRIKNILSKFKKHFTKPQFQNFCRTELRLISAGKKEHDLKSINELFIDPKDQSSLNRFITKSKWNVETVAKEGRDLLLNETKLNSDVEYKVIDDTVCRKYSLQTEMACYNHSSTMGTVLSHDYVTSLYVNNGVSVSTA
jgi:molybdopterin-biosynthesis enzyme MoeA-like protein